MRFQAMRNFFLVATAALTALGAGVPAAGQDEARLADGRALTASFFDGRTDEIWARMSSAMQTQLGSAEALAGFRTQALAQLGDEIEVLAETVTDQSGTGTYRRQARYRNTGSTVIETVFVTGSGGTIEGFWIRPAQQATEPLSATVEADVAASASDGDIATAIPHAPTLVAAEGGVHLVYEMLVQNRREVRIVVDSLVVRYDAVQLEFNRDGVATMVQNGVREVEPGSALLLHIWIDLPAAARPDAIEHSLGLADEASPIAAATVAVDEHPAIVLRPPLRGADWLAANGPSNTSNHRRARLEVDGRRVIAQRFAIDFLQVSADTTFQGAAEVNSNYFCWGAEALAVASGIVIDTKDGIPENVPGLTSRAVEITMDTVAGNYVILGLGEGRFAMYGHLQPGSLRVEVGDHVRVGDVLGLVGNSGNSTEPHLHFQVSDAPSPLGGEGLPYVFTDWTYQGNLGATEAVVEAANGSARTRTLPVENDILSFEGTQ